ncbi:MAG TPA: FAD-linked oxidase C-terminal domain-containing protein [Solirubrobacterales bacterium]|nr:FAD-linked oxidase C-terminal domain-containing protein [Solirubrobacterales bacterium]
MADERAAAPTSLLDELRRAVRDVSADPDLLASYRRDQAAPALLEAGTPAALARPVSTAEVEAAVRVAARHRVPVVPRGAGSGLTGGANAIDGCLVLGLERMDRLLDVDAAARTATFQPGLVNAALREEVRPHGLTYAPDPASMEFSTLGGNIATNAGGLCCVKYGVTRDALLELEVVLADGVAIRTGHRTRKGVAGYDLVGLLCGSEGTLGIVTEATVRLLPAPPAGCTLAAGFPTLAGAGTAVARIAGEQRPSLLELMDQATVRAVEARYPMELDLDAGAYLFAAVDEAPEPAREAIAAIARICEEEGADLVVASDDPAEGRMLTAARRLAYPALEQLGSTLLDDVAVPVPRVPALLSGVERIAAESGVLIGTFGHAGEGNMHPTIVYDHRDADQVARVRTAFTAILRLALELGGTIAGEHGVGLLKRDALDLELGPTRAVQARIKQALDPDGILNPGKGI